MGPRDHCAVPAILLAVDYVGPHDTLVEKPFVWLMGPREGLHAGSNELPWANSSGSAGGSAYTLWAHAMACPWDLRGCCGTTQADRQVAMHIHCGPMRSLCSVAILLAVNYVGPHDTLVEKPFVWLLGPREGLHTGSNELPWADSSGSACGSAYTLWAHAMACPWDLRGCCGPTRADRQAAAHIHCGPTQLLCSAAIFLAVNYAGPQHFRREAICVVDGPT
jgi:hypothetical protein